MLLYLPIYYRKEINLQVWLNRYYECFFRVTDILFLVRLSEPGSQLLQHISYKPEFDSLSILIHLFIK